jgi:hypothetical protein
MSNSGTPILIIQGNCWPMQIPAIPSSWSPSERNTFLHVLLFPYVNLIHPSTFTFLQLPFTSAMLFPEFSLPSFSSPLNIFPLHSSLLSLHPILSEIPLNCPHHAQLVDPMNFITAERWEGQRQNKENVRKGKRSWSYVPYESHSCIKHLYHELE